eukprot:m.111517 g.111517  ORF g.111517 m.111517 type:complete len:497 (-) comp12764_c8_seq3:1600-3090(-)
MSSSFRATLRPVKALRNRNVSPISLSFGVTILGRSPQTKIKLQECSRSQVELTFSQNGVVVFRQIGANASSVDGNPTARDEKITLRNGSKISFLAQQPDTTSFVLDVEEIVQGSLPETQSFDTMTHSSSEDILQTSKSKRSSKASPSPLSSSQSPNSFNKRKQKMEEKKPTTTLPTTTGTKKSKHLQAPSVLITSDSTSSTCNNKHKQPNRIDNDKKEESEHSSHSHSFGSYEPVTPLLKHDKKHSNGRKRANEEEKEVKELMEDADGSIASKKAHLTTNAFDVMLHMSAEQAKAKTPPASPRGSRWTGNRMNWANALIDIVEHPERHTQEIVHKDENVIIINDKYPKARYHFLVMPTVVIEDIYHLTPDHLHIIKELQISAMKFGQKLMENKKDITFRTGFHAIPSMRQLHLHLISQDFDSVCLKNKKHWNSFNTEYFVSPKKIHHMLRKYKKVHFDETKYREVLKRPLQCHLCKETHRTIPSLKQHLADHAASL